MRTKREHKEKNLRQLKCLSKIPAIEVRHWRVKLANDQVEMVQIHTE
jgi:hypothetical protein